MPARVINRYFSPRLQGQYVPQFVQEPFPFEEAFLVGAGQQQRLDELMKQATTLGTVPTRPIAEDISLRDQLVGGLRGEVEQILERKGGDAGEAATDISRAISRTMQHPFFRYNAPNVELYQSDIEKYGKLDQPLMRGQDVMTEPMYDKATGRYRLFRPTQMMETPDFVKRADDRFEDIAARATEKLVDVEIDGKMQSVTRKVLTDKQLRKIAKGEVDGWLRDNPWWGTYMQQQGVSMKGLRKATEDFLYDRVKFKARSDTSIEYVSIPEKKEKKRTYEGMGIGENINANVEQAVNTQRVATMLVEVPAINPSTGEPIEGPNKEPLMDEVPQEIVFSSDNEFALTHPKTGKHYTLFVSPQHMWSMSKFGERMTHPYDEDFEIEGIRDLWVSKIDIEDAGGNVLYKAGQPLPDEAIDQPGLVSNANLERKFFAIGRINARQDDEDTVMVPYDKIKNQLKSITSIEGEGGFEIDEDQYLKSMSIAGEDPLGLF